ncbi:hypothetical protein E5161_17305 [Cohnella pontilimi]|uniref:Copper amine oxidase-like N-terminal domain-containing protein n=1 Tax=Cohnella pontilimi TaxID=2564100 RepID=A0A4U0F538_9BACL|nr:stalk domain-containing protein [Cohnella pontilimi]TJY39711.1 hypothetical protein E5161_17305 [Cohnella pontilimi]
MSWKKTIAAAALTAAVSATVVSAVSAATPVTVKKAKPPVVAAAPINVMSTNYLINGADALIHTITLNGKKLVSVGDLAVALGADFSFKGNNVSVELNGHIVKLTTNSDKFTVDGVQQKLPAAVKNVQYRNFIDMDMYLKGLGVTVTTDASGTTWIDADLLPEADSAQWIGDGKLLVAHDTEAGSFKSIVDVKTGEHRILTDNTEIAELVVSPDGKKAAYTDSQGAVWVMDLGLETSKKVSDDASIKPELVWSPDQTAIYFLNSEKSNSIKKLNLADGKISTILDDKKDYKENLQVSADGKVFTYQQNTMSKVTDPGATEGQDVVDDGLTIDPSAATTNICQFVNDPSIKDNAPVQLTNSTDDKMFVKAMADGNSVVYIKVGADEKTKSVLNSVMKDKTVKTLFGDQDVLQAVFAGNNKWYLLTGGPTGKNLIYEFDAVAVTSKQLYTVSDSVSDIIAQGSSLAIIDNGIIYAQVNGKWRPVSR